MKNDENLCYERKPSHATAKVTVSKDEWCTKEDTGKSMKNALYLLRYAKAPLRLKSVKSILLAIVELC